MLGDFYRGEIVIAKEEFEPWWPAVLCGVKDDLYLVKFILDDLHYELGGHIDFTKILNWPEGEVYFNRSMGRYHGLFREARLKSIKNAENIRKNLIPLPEHIVKSIETGNVEVGNGLANYVNLSFKSENIIHDKIKDEKIKRRKIEVKQVVGEVIKDYRWGGGDYFILEKLIKGVENTENNENIEIQRRHHINEDFDYQTLTTRSVKHLYKIINKMKVCELPIYFDDKLSNYYILKRTNKQGNIIYTKVNVKSDQKVKVINKFLIFPPLRKNKYIFNSMFKENVAFAQTTGGLIKDIMGIEWETYKPRLNIAIGNF